MPSTDNEDFNCTAKGGEGGKGRRIGKQNWRKRGFLHVIREKERLKIKSNMNKRREKTENLGGRACLYKFLWTLESRLNAEQEQTEQTCLLSL